MASDASKTVKNDEAVTGPARLRSVKCGQIVLRGELFGTSSAQCCASPELARYADIQSNIYASGARPPFIVLRLAEYSKRA